ncbi:MAG: hydroxyisourate hydrolase [Thiothrix sp.]|nr:hydroxyisourate hydrolase [Thiothrix sp.]HPE60877.1 hydroxyisourate hydrolase [Thiolinea sp.]
MGKLTTHVLDTANGCPGAGIRVELYQCGPDGSTLIRETRTNHDGRCDSPLLDDTEIRPGTWELVFHTADYFRASGNQLDDPPFLDRITLRFAIADSSRHFHVPLLVSPWSYSTYRGS